MKTDASPHSRLTERQRQGQAAETAALEAMRRQGMRLIARNVRYRIGELDLIMLDQDMLVFIEVRFRRPSRFGSAATSVNGAKQRRLIRAAYCWMRQYSDGAIPSCRFDIVAIDGPRIEWIKNAFGLAGPL
ncbi:MAG: YraN family protein [Burkholderiaceae bacterium]|jgi:putative endonuclease|nr:YraN family protein [Burkholderiaceae bacterium]